MNKRFRFSLVKTVGCLRRPRQLEKVVIVGAPDSIEARRMVGEKYSDWGISMFWVIWP